MTEKYQNKNVSKLIMCETFIAIQPVNDATNPRHAFQSRDKNISQTFYCLQAHWMSANINLLVARDILRWAGIR